MKYWRRKYQVFLIILISFGILFFPTYALYYSLEGVDVFRNPHWENPDQGGLLGIFQKKWIGLGWISYGIIPLAGKEFIKLPPKLFLNPRSTDKTPVLRC